ncbi:MAG: HAMP domain-containing sensor histidine kinase [Pirellulales bacterium]
MMRPQIIWAGFAAFVLLAGAGLGWLTHQTIEVDRAQTLAREQVERDERLRLALWRIDAWLMPLLVAEASRPADDFAPWRDVPGGKETGGRRQRSASPLLAQPSPYVLIYFDWTEEGLLASPQTPTDDDLQRFPPLDEARPRIEAARRSLASLQQMTTFDLLWSQLPEAAVEPSPTLVVQESNRIATNNASQVVESLPQQRQALPQEAQQAAIPPPPPGPSQRSQSFQQENDLTSRANVFQALASKGANDAWGENRAALGRSAAVEGMSRPLWIGDELLLARRVATEGRMRVQGCWLNWGFLRQRMRAEVADVLPEVEFQAARADDVANVLATLPIRVEVPASDRAPPISRSMRWALSLAWFGCAIAALAAAVTIHSVLGLSERRAAFVAAVTHELRTPLTTFRMYAEMLVAGMVPEASRRTYLETLRSEADRLAHLVDNVLQYARLERGRPRVHRETLLVESLVERLTPRLSSRASAAGGTLEVHASAEVARRRATVDAASIEQIVFNLVDNACKYAASGAGALVELSVETKGRDLWLRVRDHGPGLPTEQLRRLFHPFSKTVQEAAASAPGVGLGLALSRRLAREMGGDLRLEQSDATGATFVLVLSRVVEE